MASTVADLITLFTLDQKDSDRFVAPARPASARRVFGGLVLAQGLVAAGRTVDPDRGVHSMHANFLHPGDPADPIEFTIERLREGRSFSTRRAVAMQQGKLLFAMTASFHSAEPGIDAQVAMSSGPSPDDLPPWPGLIDPTGERQGGPADDWAALDLRVDDSISAARDAGLRVWLRTAGAMPDDRLLHAATLAYASDLTLLAPAVLPSMAGPEPLQFAIASLDHAMWFHRPVRVDGWLRHDQVSRSSSGGLGLCSGTVFDAAGHLVATTVQEGLIRTQGDAPRP